LLFLLAAPYLAGKAVEAGQGLMLAVLRTITDRPSMTRRDPWYADVTALGGWLGALVGVALVVVASRLVASTMDGQGPGGVLLATVLLVVGLAVGAYLWAIVDGAGWSPAAAASVGLSAAAWLVLAGSLAAVVVRLVGTGRVTVALMVAVGGGAVVATLAVAMAAVPVPGRSGMGLAGALPSSLTRRDGSGLTLMLLAATAFLLSYALRAGRVAGRAPASTGDATPRGWAASRLGAIVGLLGVALWVTATAVVVPDRPATVTLDHLRYEAWARDLRQAAILVAVLGLILWLSARGPAVLSGVLALTALAATDLALAGWSGSRLVPSLITLVAAAAAGLGGWALTRLRAGAGVAYTRPWGGVAIVSAYCAPTLMWRGGWSTPTFVAVPPGLAEGTGAVVGLLIALAVAGVLQARGARAGDRGTIAATAILAAEGAALAYALTFGTQWTTLTAFLGVPLVVVALVVMRGPSDDPPPFRAARWLFGVPLAMLMSGLLLVMCVLAPEFLFGQWVAGDSHPVLPGAAVVGALLAVVAAPLVRRTTRMPAADAEPAHLGPAEPAAA
jgi:hypothetical protein